ncbi:4-oxalomesaconate tautomerase [Pseudogulbenkiania sp. MAI-1]|uniref:4-oxalomesaconate tautomerase n=1 Tax=Pseudogulbenkiania sp. MAI-1 TaxID=990370 RepID=UPI00045E95B9|nr:4-oxalomesaconate tautomerase [Pseudogulbenkiania sp. MAI-1]
MLIPIPCVVMRGGTSKGPFFLSRDLPRDESTRNKVLLAVMGSPDKRQIDGLGGGDSLSSKVVMVDASSRPGVDVEYLFAQVSVDSATVDTAPNCGNMLSGVAPFAIEHGLVAADMPTTTVRIYNQNTGKIVEAVVQTPGGKVNYEGDVRIDGVPGSGAPILLNFLDAAGAKTGKLLPTGKLVDEVDGVEITCLDFSTPIVFIAAQSVGKTGYETKQELDADAELLARLERIRLKAAVLMGMGDVSGQVLPKVVLLAKPAKGGNISSRYFVPWNCHAAHAVTGALCVAAACSIPGTVAASLVQLSPQDPSAISIEHPAGRIDTRIIIDGREPDGMPAIRSAGLVRTAKPIVSGVTYVPGAVWDMP